MASVPSRVADRLAAGLKRFQPIITSAKVRDVNESDTVIVVTDMLSEVFGYDKYSEITSEFAVKSSFCDLATKVDGSVQCLIEVKAIGTELKESHTKQAVDYAANQGVDWVALTNAAHWKIYKVNFAKPITQELIIDIDVTALNFKKDEDIECLFLLAKEGFQKSALGDYSDQRQALNRFSIAAMIQTDPVVDVIRRELRRMSPDVRIDCDQILAVLVTEVLKRDVLEGDKAEEARKKISRAAHRALRAKAVGASGNGEKTVETPTGEKPTS
jgi:hypothetical protein